MFQQGGTYTMAFESVMRELARQELEEQNKRLTWKEVLGFVFGFFLLLALLVAVFGWLASWPTVYRDPNDVCLHVEGLDRQGLPVAMECGTEGKFFWEESVSFGWRPYKRNR